jgi:hypothetical protein
VGLRDWLRKLERDSRSDMPSFELLDGTRFYHTQAAELYLYYHHCIGTHPDEWTPVPEPLMKVLEARDTYEALRAIGAYSYEDIFPYSFDAIIRDRQLVPRSLVEGEDPYERVIDDLSE